MKFEIVTDIEPFESEPWKQGRPKVDWLPIHHALAALNPGETLIVSRDEAAMSCVSRAVGQVARDTAKKFSQRKLLLRGGKVTAIQLRHAS